MIRFIFGMIDRIIALTGALLFSQAPMFIHQYIQNLSGHVAELNIQIQSLRTVSSATGKSLPEYIAKFTESSDLDFQAQGKWISGVIDRSLSMGDSLSALQDSSLLTRPLLFIRHCYLDIVEQTYHDFTPGLPFSVEGAAYAFAGMVLFSSIFWMLKLCIRRIYGYRRGSQHEKLDCRTAV